MLWLGVDSLECDLNSSVKKIKSLTMKVARGLVVISIPVAASKAFHFFNFALPFTNRIIFKQGDK